MIQRTEQKGFVHIGTVALLVLVVAAIGLGGYRVASRNKTVVNSTITTNSDTDQKLKDQERTNEDKAGVAPVSTDSDPGSASSQSTRSTAQIATTTPTAAPASATTARVQLANGAYFDVPLNKGGPGDGYYDITCTKGGPGSEDNRPVVSVKTSQGVKSVRICKHYSFPTTQPDEGTARIALADGKVFDYRYQKGGPVSNYEEGYLIPGCASGVGPGPVIQVLTPTADVYQTVQLCADSILPTAQEF